MTTSDETEQPDNSKTQLVEVADSSAEAADPFVEQRGPKAGFGKHLFPGVDMNALLDTNIDDVFEEYR